ncbi:hypothetical protein BSIN_4525 [Burkholderia singularis]|uniref:Uncharacterized protein n=1 Tax=Burkholderia singularis TaxID=1503053 RepID=A0A238H8Y4_9BURK|nr:hypothetical protein BSIN_4525 [Burkholderia singularis]
MDSEPGIRIAHQRPLTIASRGSSRQTQTPRSSYAVTAA